MWFFIMTPMIIAGRIEFPIVEERIREYSRIEVYKGYDDCHSVDDTITSSDIDTTWRLNSYMHSQKPEGREVLNKCRETEVILARIPKNMDLAQIPEPQWANIKKEIMSLLLVLMRIHNLKLAKAMKLIHLKRPDLIPILDNFVTLLLTKRNPNGRSPYELAALASTALEIARSDLITNIELLKNVQSRISDLTIPLPLVRIYDIICWTYWKWDLPENNPTGEVSVTRWVADNAAFTGYRPIRQNVVPRTLLRYLN
jgi:hypothetical protein